MKYWKNKMTPEEITIQEMGKSYRYFKKRI